MAAATARAAKGAPFWRASAATTANATSPTSLPTAGGSGSRNMGQAPAVIMSAAVANQTSTMLASQTLTAAQLSGNTQIEFDLAHVAGSNAVTATFELINNGVVGPANTLASSANTSRCRRARLKNSELNYQMKIASARTSR